MHDGRDPLGVALRRIELFRPFSRAERDQLATAIIAILDELAAARGDVIDFPKRCDRGPHETKETDVS